MRTLLRRNDERGQVFVIPGCHRSGRPPRLRRPRRRRWARVPRQAPPPGLRGRGGDRRRTRAARPGRGPELRPQLQRARRREERQRQASVRHHDRHDEVPLVRALQPGEHGQVEQTTVVPTIFAKVLGIDHFTIRAKATACSPCSSKPLDIMLVLDRTGSMCQTSNGTQRPCLHGPDQRAQRPARVRPLHGPGDPQDRPRGLPAGDEQRSTLHHACVGQLQLDVRRVHVGPALERLQDRRQPERVARSSSRRSAARRAAGRPHTRTRSSRHRPSCTSSRGRPGVQNVIVFFSDGAANTGPTLLLDDVALPPPAVPPGRQLGRRPSRAQGR